MKRNKTSIVGGVFFILVGVIFLLDAAGIWHARPGLVLPIVVIAFGVAILAGSVGE